MKVPLGELLIGAGLLTKEQLDSALAEQSRSGELLGRILVASGVLSENRLVAMLAEQMGLEFLDLSDYPIDAAAVGLITESLARRYEAIPIGWEDDRLVIAMANPTNVFALDDIRTMTGQRLKTVVTTVAQLSEIVERYFSIETEVDSVAQAAADEMDDDGDLSGVYEVLEDSPIVKFVNIFIAQAVTERASDIHIEPAEHDFGIRFRIDGVLHERMRSPRSILGGVVSRLKVMADIDIAERRVPQDGRLSIKTGGRSIDLRVATLPMVFGEKVVLRILDKGQAPLRLQEIGFLPETLERFKLAYSRPSGTIVVTGPTGAGKSTTLYALLNILNVPGRNVITIEDPVEYRLPGLNQMQINHKAGLTFAGALRSLLRADPDVMMVGEIRDSETAVIAIEAALTGHLVLTTLHTNDAASTPMRLIEMGVEPFLVTNSLHCITAQRLARRLCDKCKESYEPTEAELIEAARQSSEVEYLPETLASVQTKPVLKRPVGCRSCGGTGYHGRLGIHEVMLMTEEIKQMVIERRSVEEIQRAAVAQGMLTLHDDGLHKVEMGLTSLEEMFRVVV